MSQKYRTKPRQCNGESKQISKKTLRYDELHTDPWLIELSESDRKFYEAILRTSDKLSAFSLNGYLFQFEGERR